MPQMTVRPCECPTSLWSLPQGFLYEGGFLHCAGCGGIYVPKSLTPNPSQVDTKIKAVEKILADMESAPQTSVLCYWTKRLENILKGE
jgi:hypothetical protein